ncbi:hypothetical protein D7B24_004841 [Verticillium nonalfalfae]|uniref:Uncharacterized protein n=1 Tax=Verticillium nonalfalfae TaxID=1051616 RepID=A0A3M9YD37_9PEZI|nr:uncharacterized protein D7B24_004841 [Verticillium nonalfalfae]RNJ58389.1 hypothetical protein D7B24_004841 [Verticillium nonalfalfae]
MRFAPILFNFVAGVSAIDIWLNWDATDCRGKNSVHCANIPTGWNIRATGHQGSQCGNIISSQATFGQDTSVCMSFGGYGGGGYHFINDRRRSVRAREDCADVVRPSIVSFGGVKFNLTSLDEASYLEMEDLAMILSFSLDIPVDIAAADRDLEDVPEKFHVYKME